jgi:hypothetical protein
MWRISSQWVLSKQVARCGSMRQLFFLSSFCGVDGMLQAVTWCLTACMLCAHHACLCPSACSSRWACAQYGSCMQAFAQLHGVSFEVLQLFVWQQARPWLHADSSDGGMPHRGSLVCSLCISLGLVAKHSSTRFRFVHVSMQQRLSQHAPCRSLRE